MIEAPTISSAVWPKIFWALRFQLVMMPLRCMPTIASLEDATMLARRSVSISACLRAVMSRMMPATRRGSPPSSTYTFPRVQSQ